MKDRRLFWILLPILLVVWGFIVYRFNEAMEAPGTPDSKSTHLSPDASRSSPVTAMPFVYTQDVRDPFVYQVPRPKVSPRLAASVEPPWEPPPLRLTGVLGAKKKKTAVIEDLNGSTYLLHRGDTLSGVTILTIADSRVEYSYKKKHASWTLSPDGQ